MEILSKEKGKYYIVEVEGRLDTSNYEELSKELNKITDSGNKFLVLNLDKLEYISSSGLRVFLTVLKSLRAIEGDVILCCMNDKIKSVFEVSGFLTLFNVVEGLENLDN